jgi:hypothetical protein
MPDSHHSRWANPKGENGETLYYFRIDGYDNKYITMRLVNKMTRAITFGNVLCKARIAIVFLGVL